HLGSRRQRRMCIRASSCPRGEPCLLLHRYPDPDDPDMNTLIMPRLLLGWPEGHLSLGASYGPVIWSSSLFVAHHQENAPSLYR
ncbi:hypothetical protein QMN96_26255, partial [Escherichia coli]|nr:hypothetical protein [Escherichia coli]